LAALPLRHRRIDRVRRSPRHAGIITVDVNRPDLFAAEDSGHYTCPVKEGNWEVVSSDRHFANAHVEVVTDHVQMPTRSQPRTWTIVHRKAAVVIAPMTQDRKIVLIHQERIPIRQAIWEMPSGQIDVVAGGGDSDRGLAETIEQVALRELREEAGYELAKDGELISLGYYFSSPGFTDERGYFFLARPVVLCPDYVRDESESILDCRPFTISEIRRMIEDNEIRDGNTLGMCARLAACGFISLESR
jgi:8-oxo-dGTP pyrophosphatase MutT (NUDIX family)